MAIPFGAVVDHKGVVTITVSLAVAMTEILSTSLIVWPPLDTYTLVPSGVIAIPRGLIPTGMVAITVLKEWKHS